MKACTPPSAHGIRSVVFLCTHANGICRTRDHFWNRPAIGIHRARICYRGLLSEIRISTAGTNKVLKIVIVFTADHQFHSRENVVRWIIEQIYDVYRGLIAPIPSKYCHKTCRVAPENIKRCPKNSNVILNSKIHSWRIFSKCCYALGNRSRGKVARTNLDKSRRSVLCAIA